MAWPPCGVQGGVVFVCWDGWLPVRPQHRTLCANMPGLLEWSDVGFDILIGGWHELYVAKAGWHTAVHKMRSCLGRAALMERVAQFIICELDTMCMCVSLTHSTHMCL